MNSHELRYLKDEIAIKLKFLIDSVDHVDQREDLEKVLESLLEINVWTVD
jgi:hypothetical protein